MVDKFRGLEGKVRKELEKLKNEPDRNRAAIEAYEHVLGWISELNNMEVLEQRQMVA
jgi:hypothetical protein